MKTWMEISMFFLQNTEKQSVGPRWELQLFMLCVHEGKLGTEMDDYSEAGEILLASLKF